LRAFRHSAQLTLTVHQAALNAGDPIALTRLPPELADAAVAQWEQALRLAQQTAKGDDNAARATLEQLRRETDLRVHSIELREKEWDLAARVRERALTDAREQVNVLLKELATDRAELRARDARIVDLESQLEEYRRQIATLITRAIAKNRALSKKTPQLRSRAKLKRLVTLKKRVPRKPNPRRVMR
jgi:chromosome segregation ATPase